ncbi:MAG: MBL fold metallo-hydrolase [Betaproteobacteria bacterium]|nr:MBL fold metallo-hydrolase [Betaproteobacteria bacterium]
MTALQIIRIPILPFGMVNCHLILGPNGCILVDTGLPRSEAKIERALTKRGRSFKDIKLIVVTHAHVDHAGSAALLRELSGAPIVAHDGDARYFSRDTPMTFCPTGYFGRLFLRTPLMFEPYTGFEPDIFISNDGTLDLSRYGIPGAVKHTPGHTAGSISIELSTKDVLVGDLIASGILLGGLVRTRHAKRPPFEDDPRAVALALQRLLDSGMERFYMGHGGPLNACEVQRHAQALEQIPRSKYASERR